MSYCPKCGNKVEESMAFCPKCGASLRLAAAPSQAPPPTYRRGEKSEKGEKNEKNESEKGEKGEKREHGHIGWLIAGLVIVFFGIFAFAGAANWFGSDYQNYQGPIALLIVGIAIIIVAIWFATMGKKRNPAP